jgi:hypothetical protein
VLNPIFADVTVIVRECGERTADACVDALEAFGATRVHRVATVPFSRSLRRSLELGLEQARPWTLCIDADVIPNRSGLIRLLCAARKLPRSRFELQGLVFDKFFAVHRPCGNHLYRTELIPGALQMIPLEGTSLRPETEMLNRMAAAGHRWAQSRVVTGVHDFEQHPTDIYRKCFLHARKHRDHAPYLAAFWNTFSAADDDFRIALEALRKGMESREAVYVSKEFFAGPATEALKRLQVEEKPPLTGAVDADSLRASLQRRLSPDQARWARRIERDTYPLSAAFLHSEVHHWIAARARRLPRTLRTYVGAAIERTRAL